MKLRSLPLGRLGGVGYLLFKACIEILHLLVHGRLGLLQRTQPLFGGHELRLSAVVLVGDLLQLLSLLLGFCLEFFVFFLERGELLLCLAFGSLEAGGGGGELRHTVLSFSLLCVAGTKVPLQLQVGVGDNLFGEVMERM